MPSKLQEADGSDVLRKHQDWEALYGHYGTMDFPQNLHYMRTLSHHMPLPCKCRCQTRIWKEQEFVRFNSSLRIEQM